jgi:hypothetical protein
MNWGRRRRQRGYRGTHDTETHLEVDLLEGSTRSVVDEGLSEGNDPLANTRARSLDDDKVVLDDTISHETSHGCNGLDRRVKVSGGRGGIVGLSNAVDLLVEFCFERQWAVLAQRGS